jgi:hypothetical protein
MKRLLKLALAVLVMSGTGFVFAADESRPAPEARKGGKEPMDPKSRLERLEKRLEAEKAKETPNKELISKLEQVVAALKDVVKLESDKKALLEKDAKADTSAIDAQIKSAKNKIKELKPKRDEGRKSGNKPQ